jgi:trans-aconitate 2-methyltransferase
LPWNPSLYLTFGDHRTRPVHELLARVPLEAPARIADLGCGPGNSTAAIAARWPNAHIVGLDNSREMLARAAKSGLKAEWIEGDIATWRPALAVDLVFANASLQWVPEPEHVALRLFSFVATGGVLAFQVPANLGGPPHTLVDQALAETGLMGAVPLSDLSRHVLPAADYYRVLAPDALEVDVWDTEYQQALEGADAVYRWIEGTALVPILAALVPMDRERFTAQLKPLLRAHYPVEADNRALMAFRRRFVVARK